MIFKRFQTKLVVLFAALFVLVQAMTYSSVYFATKNNLDAQVSEQLKYGGRVFNQTLLTLSDGWLNETSIFSTDYGFKSAITTFDEDTIQSALQNLTERVGANLSMIVSLEGEMIVQISDDERIHFGDGEFNNMISIADENGSSTAYIEIQDKIYQYTIVPVLAPVPVAWVGVGIHVDNAMISEIQKTLPVGVDITLIERFTESNLLALETTLEGEARAEIDNVLSKSLAIGDVNFDSIGGYKFMAYEVPLPTSLASSDVSAVLTYSLEAAYSPYMPLAYLLLILAGLGLFSLIAGSVTVARSVASPLQVLTRAARMIQIGRYEKIKDISQQDEIGQLADHFNQMIIGIQDREEQIIYQAEHDLETGLPNRKSLEKYLGILFENHKDTGQMFSVLQISINRFDDVRNTIGHEMARSIVKKIGLRLLRNATSQHFVSRLSTSHFCIVQEGGNQVSSKKFAQEIMDLFEQPLCVDNITIDISVSIGIACCPDHADTVDLIVQRASIAALHAQDALGNISLYDQNIDKYDPDQLSLMGDLRKSLEEGDVKFYYQPKIDLRLGHITHVEALVRWIHPERGFIPPDEFIGMAEQTGHIHHLTMWGLDEAIKQSRAWADEGIDLKVAINLSARDLSNRKLPEIIIKLLEKYRVPRSRLVLEVTESAIMQDPEMAMGVLNALDQHGLLLSIDDYGTGQSSMAYLKKLPVKELKIDKSFVLDLANNEEDEILVRSTVELGHNLGLKVTAEGVEDQQSMDMLTEFGCDLVQGFYVSKPLPVADLYDFLENSPYGLKERVAVETIVLEAEEVDDEDNPLVNLIEHRLNTNNN